MKGFNQVDKQVVESLMRMKSPEMLPLTKFLKDMLEDTKDLLVAAGGDTVTRLQGKAAVLKDLVDAIENAAKTMEKMRQ